MEGIAGESSWNAPLEARGRRLKLWKPSLRVWDLSIIHIRIKVEDVTPKFKAAVTTRDQRAKN